jgi:PAS domain S-box-containing protein
MQDASAIDFTLARPNRPGVCAWAGAWLGGVLRQVAAPLHSFRMQTALLFGGLIVLFCGMAALALGHMLTAEIRRDSARSLNAVAQSAARTLASGLSQRLLETRVLAESAALWVDGLDSAAVRQALARAQAAQPYSAWIGVADANGRVQSATSGLLVGQSVAQRPWFSRGLKGEHVGDVHRAALLEKLLPRDPGGEPIRFVDFSAPITVNAKVVGVLGMHGTWDWSRDVVRSLLPSDASQRGLEVYIFDRAGKLLHSPSDAAKESATRTHDDLQLDELLPVQDPIRDGDQSARVVVWPDGLAYLTTVVALPAQSAVTDMGWQILAREPVAIAFARAGAAAWQAFGIGLVLAAFAGVLAWFASGLLGRPLIALAKAAREVQDRVPGAAIPMLCDNHEVQHLSTALAGMTNRLDATYRTAPVGMCQADLGGSVLSANARLGSILGLPTEGLLQRRLADLIADRDRSVFVDDLCRLGQGRIQTLARELCLVGAPGVDLRVAMSASMVAPIDGAAAYFIVVVEDISQRIAAEAADRANAAKTAFLSQVSHELRTPLNAVLGFSQLIQLDGRDELSARQLIRVDAIAEAGGHLLAMIDDLLDLTQIESNRLALSPEPVLLSIVLDQSVALVSEAAAAAGIALNIRPPASALENCVLADHVRLRQVLVNLLGNAVKYNRKGGKVTVTWAATADGKRIALTVGDTGRGIRADRMGELFQPFNRLGAESSAIKGTGIGLAITRKLVEMMNGRIEVASTPDVGSRFSIELPVADPQRLDLSTLDPWAPVRSVDAGPPDAASGGRRTVMYVEDNEVNVVLLSAAIEFRPRLRLVVARSGEEALTLAAASPHDVFLLDMHLGDMTGLALASRLARLPHAAGAPMIALSADATPTAIASALDAGFAAYLTKPLDLRRFLDCLDAAVQTASMAE